MKSLKEEASELLKHETPAMAKQHLIEKGYSEDEVDEILGESFEKRDELDTRNSKIFTWHELFDRVGYGATSPQFINILFAMSGAGLFLIGLFNGLKTVLSILITSVLQEYSKVHRVSKNLISGAGILFGFSFLFMAFAVRARIVWLFATSMLIAALGVVAYGDLYRKLVQETLRREKRGKLLNKLGIYGILVTMITMVISGYLIDYFPETGSKIAFTLFNHHFSLLPIGYLLSFEITAFAFIVSGYLLSFIKEKREARSYPLFRFIKEHESRLRHLVKGFLSHKYISLMLIATAISGLLELLGNSYYGLFIYQHFNKVAFGGFLNVAAIMVFAILVSFLGPWFTSRLQRSIGLAPMLVFGTLLVAILPLTMVFNARFMTVGVAFGIAVIGGAIVGYAQGLLTRKLMNAETRRDYFLTLGPMLSVPYLILVPLGAWLAQALGMQTLFLIIGIGLCVVVTPIYFILVALANKERL